MCSTALPRFAAPIVREIPRPLLRPTGPTRPGERRLRIHKALDDPSPELVRLLLSDEERLWAIMLEMNRVRTTARNPRRGAMHRSRSIANLFPGGPVCFP